MSKQLKNHWPRTDAELVEIAENLFLNRMKIVPKKSASETEDVLEFEDSGSEYVPSEDDSQETDFYLKI